MKELPSRAMNQFLRFLPPFHFTSPDSRLRSRHNLEGSARLDPGVSRNRSAQPNVCLDHFDKPSPPTLFPFPLILLTCECPSERVEGLVVYVDQPSTPTRSNSWSSEFLTGRVPPRRDYHGRPCISIRIPRSEYEARCKEKYVGSFTGDSNQPAIDRAPWRSFRI
jgi:hypothetical protein